MLTHFRTAGRAQLGVELLESRDVPAGNIAATLSPSGVLTLIGDDFGNGIERLTVGTSSVTVDPDATTTVNGGIAGAAVTFLGHTAAVTAILNGGPDELRIDPSADFILPGVAYFDLGDGDNSLALVQNSATEELLRPGSLVVRAGDGLDTVSINGGYRGTEDDPGGTQVSYIPSAVFNYGDGGSNSTFTNIILGGVPRAQPISWVRITGGDGLDEITGTVLGKLAVTGGPGLLRLYGSYGLTLDATGEEVELQNSTFSFVNITGWSRAAVTSDGFNSFQQMTVQALRRDGVATVEVNGGNLQATGFNSIASSSLNIRSGGSAAFVVRQGPNSSPFQSEFEIYGRVNVAAGLGDAEFWMDGGRALINGPLSVTSTAGNARVIQNGSSSKLQLTQFAEIHGPAANLAVSAFKDARVELQSGQDEFAGAISVSGLTSARLLQDIASTATVAGSVRVAGGASEAVLDIGGDSWIAKGTTTVTSAGRAVLNVGAVNSGRLEGNVSVLGGLGLDELTTKATARILKNLSVTLGTGGGHVEFEPGTTVGGALTVTGGTGVDTISLRGVAIGGAVRIVTGAGKDILDVDLGSTFAETFFADLGAGDDLITFAQSVASTGAVVFTGKTTVLAGSGNDTLLLGKALSAGGDANSKVVFNVVLNSISGGLGLNSFDDEAAQFQLIGAATLSSPSWTDPVP